MTSALSPERPAYAPDKPGYMTNGYLSPLPPLTLVPWHNGFSVSIYVRVGPNDFAQRHAFVSLEAVGTLAVEWAQNPEGTMRRHFGYDPDAKWALPRAVAAPAPPPAPAARPTLDLSALEL